MLRVAGSNTKEELAGGTWWYETDETEGEDSWRAGTGEFWINVCKAEDAADEMTGWNVDEDEEFWTDAMHDSDVEGWLYVRLKDDDSGCNDDGVTSNGKDEIDGDWGSDVAGCPDNVKGRSGVDEDSWSGTNGDAVKPEAEETGGTEGECWPNGRASEVEGWGFTAGLEYCWLNENKGCRSCCTNGGRTFDDNEAQVVEGGLGLDKVDLANVHAGDVDTDDVKQDDANVVNVGEADNVVADVEVDNVDEGNVDNDAVDVVVVGCSGLLDSIIEIKTDDQYEIWRAAFSAEPQAVPSGVSGEAWNACSWEETSLKELMNGNGPSDEGPSLLATFMAIAPTTAS